MVVHHLADAADARFEHPVGGGVGDHQGRQVGGVGSGLGLQVGDVDVALGIAGHRHHPHPRHHRAGGIGAVGAGGDQAHLPVALAPAAVPGPDHHQAGVLPLGTGVRLQGHPRKAGDRPQPGLQIRHQGGVAGGLVGGGEGMDLGEGRPAHRRQFGGGIQLHRAAAQRDHAVDERQVLAHQTLDVAQQLRLAAIAMEHLLAQPGTVP